jgi:hypothetical protein
MKTLKKLRGLPSPTNLATDVKENILAFRTITTLLAEMQQQSLISEDDLKPKTPNELEELSILNALATVIVMDGSYVIATVASTHPGGKIEVVACKQPISKEKKNEATASTSTLSHVIKSFVVLMNPRRDHVVSDTCLALNENPENRANPISLDDLEDQMVARQKLIEYVRKRL